MTLFEQIDQLRKELAELTQARIGPEPEAGTDAYSEAMRELWEEAKAKAKERIKDIVRKAQAVSKQIEDTERGLAKPKKELQGLINQLRNLSKGIDEPAKDDGDKPAEPTD